MSRPPLCLLIPPFACVPESEIVPCNLLPGLPMSKRIDKLRTQPQRSKVRKEQWGYLALVHAFASRKIHKVNLAATHRVAANFACSDENGEYAVAAAGLQVHRCLTDHKSILNTEPAVKLMST